MTFASLVVEVATFVGVTMLLSHLTRSASALIGVAVVLWVFLDFFWSIMVLSVSTTLVFGVHSANYTSIFVESNFFNPAQFYLVSYSSSFWLLEETWEGRKPNFHTP